MMIKKGFKDFPSLHFEVQKRKWNDNEIRWMCRVGDLSGSVESMNVTKEEMIQELIDEINDYDEENK